MTNRRAMRNIPSNSGILIFLFCSAFVAILTITTLVIPILIIVIDAILAVIYRVKCAKHKAIVRQYLNDECANSVLCGNYCEGVSSLLPNSECFILFCENSIKIQPIDGVAIDAELSYSKLVNFGIYTKEDVTQHAVNSNKSVIGRGIAGGVLFGGVGATVGGMSAVGASSKIIEHKKQTQYLIANYMGENADINVLSFILPDASNCLNKALKNAFDTVPFVQQKIKVKNIFL